MPERAFPITPIAIADLGTLVLARPEQLMVGDFIEVHEHVPVVGMNDDGSENRATTVVKLAGRNREVTFQARKVTHAEVTRVTEQYIYTRITGLTRNGRQQTFELDQIVRHQRNAKPNHKKLVYRDGSTGPVDRSVDILEHSRIANCARFKSLVETAVTAGLEIEDVHALICETPDAERYGEPVPGDRLASLWVRGVEEARPWVWKVMRDIAARPQLYVSEMAS